MEPDLAKKKRRFRASLVDLSEGLERVTAWVPSHSVDAIPAYRLGRYRNFLNPNCCIFIDKAAPTQNIFATGVTIIRLTAERLPVQFALPTTPSRPPPTPTRSPSIVGWQPANWCYCHYRKSREMPSRPQFPPFPLSAMPYVFPLW